jgi:hypothetical protein
MTLKGRKKERQDWQYENQNQPIRTLQEQLTKMLLSTHLSSIEIKQCLGENGKKTSDHVISGAPSLGAPPTRQLWGSTLPFYSFFYLNKVILHLKKKKRLSITLWLSLDQWDPAEQSRPGLMTIWTVWEVKLSVLKGVSFHTIWLSKEITCTRMGM